eukprot:TRINITY_DN1017_c0_g2_i1.p1 TRINITY_DN1017_c0_g2~~TRINITY_DN1017_c0_g2_i1.p1  ORF type:complete len:343 (-),score=101.31 TRINITY_DN1017_c0_g2_i1:261-1289(-)
MCIRDRSTWGVKNNQELMKIQTLATILLLTISLNLALGHFLPSKRYSMLAPSSKARFGLFPGFLSLKFDTDINPVPQDSPLTQDFEIEPEGILSDTEIDSAASFVPPSHGTEQNPEAHEIAYELLSRTEEKEAEEPKENNESEDEEPKANDEKDDEELKEKDEKEDESEETNDEVEKDKDEAKTEEDLNETATSLYSLVDSETQGVLQWDSPYNYPTPNEVTDPSFPEPSEVILLGTDYSATETIAPAPDTTQLFGVVTSEDTMNKDVPVLQATDVNNEQVAVAAATNSDDAAVPITPLVDSSKVNFPGLENTVREIDPGFLGLKENTVPYTTGLPTTDQKD